MLNEAGEEYQVVSSLRELERLIDKRVALLFLGIKHVDAILGDVTHDTEANEWRFDFIDAVFRRVAIRRNRGVSMVIPENELQQFWEVRRFDDAQLPPDVRFKALIQTCQSQDCDIHPEVIEWEYHRGESVGPEGLTFRTGTHHWFVTVKYSDVKEFDTVTYHISRNQDGALSSE